MDRRDQELLSKQLRGMRQPRNDGVISLILVVVFFAGMIIGANLFAGKDELSLIAMASNEAKATLSLP